MSKPTKHYYDYEIVWEKVTTTNPALDFNNPEAMVSIPMFTDVTTIEKDTNLEVETQRKRVNWIITDQREKFVATKNQLYNKGIYSETLPCVKQQRWSSDSIQMFLNGEIKAIDIKLLYEDIYKKWEENIEFPDPRLYHLFTIWTLGTYFFPLFHCYPYLYLTGLKDTGKTKVLEVARQLCFNARLSASITGSALFRFVQGTRCTLLMDETEKLQYREGSSKTTERAAEIRALLLAGYKKGGTATRSERPTQQGTFEPTEFECYSPKMIANIGGIEDVLESRCIQVVMIRTISKEISETEVDPREKTWEEIRNGLYLLTMLHWREVKGVYEGFVNTTNLITRQYELWKPVFVLASWLEENGVDFNKGLQTSSEASEPCEPSEGYNNIKKLASETSLELKIEETTERWESLLLQSLVLLVKKDGYIKVKEITRFFKDTMDIRSEGCNSSWVGRSLKRLGFKDKRRMGTGVEYNFSVKTIEERAKRYGFDVDKIKEDFSTKQETLELRTPSQGSQDTQASLNSEASEPSKKLDQRFTTQDTLTKNKRLDIDRVIDTLSILERENPDQEGVPIEQISQHSGLRIGIVEPCLLWLAEEKQVLEVQPGFWIRM